MVIKNGKAFSKGLLLMASFFVVLVLMFMPLFGGGDRPRENALEAADKLFNSISKGSTNYIPDLNKKVAAYKGKSFTATIKLKDDQGAQAASKLLTAGGAQAKVEAGNQLAVSGDLGQVLEAAIKDSEAMFNNREAEVSSRYGFPGKEALFVWWNVFKELHKDLYRAQRFKEGDLVTEVVQKGVEAAYNYFGIVPETVGSKAGILTFSLIFYVIYTLWWGIAILYFFEGVGLELKAGAKKEV
jgi:hypothetical protein